MSESRAVGPVDRGIDVAAVLALTSVALVNLEDSFSSRAYLVTGLAGIVTVTAWALVCAVQRWSAGVFVLGAAAAFPLVGASAALHDFSWLGFPSPQGVVDLLSATLTGPAEFLTTIPPVDAEGAVLVLPFTVCYVLGGAGAWAALRTSRPVLPVVPLVLVLAVCVVVGTEDPDGLLVRAVVFATVTLLWIAHRSSRLVGVDRGSRGRLTRGVAGLALVLGAVAVSAPLGAASTDDSRSVLRGRVGGGHDVSRLDNPLSSFRRFTPQPPEAGDDVAGRRLLRVRGLPEGVPLRFVALDVYDGTAWSADNGTVADSSLSLFQRIGQRVVAPLPGEPVAAGVEVTRRWASSWLPLAGQLTGISFDYLDGAAQREDVRYNVATSTGMVVGGLARRDDYSFSAVLPRTRLTRDMTPYGDGTQLQPSGDFLDDWLRPWRESGLTPMRQLFSLATYLRANGRYSDGGVGSDAQYLPGHSAERLGRGFVEAPRIVGNDEQYAAFMALAANRLGVPARVVLGATPGPKGWVLGRSVRGWVEVRIANGSWRVLPTRRFMSTKPPRRADVPEPTSRFVGRVERRQRAQEEALDSLEEAPRPQDPQQPLPPPESTGGVPAGLVAVGVPLLLVGAVPGAKLVRRARRRRRERVSRRFVDGWQEVLDAVRDTGREVPHGLPRTEQARALGLSLDLARRVDADVFAREEPSAERATALWTDVRAEARRVRAAAGPLWRVAAWWNPASLVDSASRARRGLSRGARRGGPSGAGGRSWRAARPAPAASGSSARRR